MITLLERIFIKQGKDERRAYGILCGTLGIALNLLISGWIFEWLHRRYGRRL
mgnify:CR=1 FL=1